MCIPLDKRENTVGGMHGMCVLSCRILKRHGFTDPSLIEKAIFTSVSRTSLSKISIFHSVSCSEN